MKTALSSSPLVSSDRQVHHRSLRLRRRQVLLLVHLSRLLPHLLRSLDWTEMVAADRKRLRTALTRLESDVLLAHTACSAPIPSKKAVGSVSSTA